MTTIGLGRDGEWNKRWLVDRCLRGLHGLDAGIVGVLQIGARRGGGEEDSSTSGGLVDRNDAAGSWKLELATCRQVEPIV